jgi:hypothetical protein
MKKKFEKLLAEYSKIKDELENHTSDNHDNMLHDIQGYYENLNLYLRYGNKCVELDIDESYESLKKQLKAARMLLKAHQSLNYIFG